MRFLWVVHDASGAELRSSETFASQHDAEAWMGLWWAELLTEGGESASLLRDGEVVYRMGLTPP